MRSSQTRALMLTIACLAPAGQALALAHCDDDAFGYPEPTRRGAPSAPINLLDIRALPDSPNGVEPVSSWTLRGTEFRQIGGGLGPCAPFQDVGSPPEGDSPGGAAFGPDGSWFVVAHRDSRNLLVYDADTRDLIQEIPLSGSPVDLAVSVDGHWAVTPNLFEDTASIVDLGTGTEVAVLAVGDAPITARITPDGATALVGSAAGADVAVIDIATATELHRIPGVAFAVTLSANFESFAVSFAAANPLEIATDSVAVFPDLFNDRIGFVDIDAGTVSYIPTADSPRNVAITPDGSLAVATHAFGTSNTLSVIDVPSQSIIKSIDIGTTLWGPVSLDPAGSKAAVAVQNAVRIVDLATDTVSPNLNTASVNRLITTADGLYALGVGFRGSLISYASETVVNELNNVVSTSLGAVSPTDPRAVMFATTFGEDMVVVNTDGASGFLEEVRPSGPAPEGDKPRTIAVTPDGAKLLTANQFSQNVSVFDAQAMNLLGHVDTGRRPGQVRVTPDGGQAIVTNRDESFVTVIDLATLTPTDIAISTRGDQIEISPDGSHAYVAVVVSDGVWRINLDTLAVEGPKLATGNMGGVGHVGNQFSGTALSHNGATLVTCNSFSDTISIIDTAAWSVVATVPVGDFPTAAAFSPDDSRIYVSNRNPDTVSVVTNDGADSTQIAVVPVGDAPFEGVVSADGSTLYVMNTSDKEIGIVDTVGLTMTGTIPVDETPVGILLDSAGGRLLVANASVSASTNGEITQFGQLALIDTATDTVAETLCADHFLSELAADADFDLAGAPGLGGESAIFFDIGGGENTPPEVTILAPPDGSTFPEGAAVTFTGSAIDAEDGDLSSELEWSSSLDGPFGMGASVTISTLSVGTHAITAEVTDSEALPGSDLINITIEAAGGPIAEITPDSFSFEVPQGGSDSDTLNIGNIGGSDLTWSLDEAAPVAVPEAAPYTYGLAETPAFHAPVGSDRASAAAEAAGAPLRGALLPGPRASARPASVPAERVVLPAPQPQAIGDFSEGFDDITQLPGAGWALINNSEPVGPSSWFQGNPSIFPAHEGDPDAYIAANFESTADNGTISNWLLTPEVTIVNGTELCFWTRKSELFEEFLDRLEVRMSVEGASTDVGETAESVGDFTSLLLTIEPDLELPNEYPEEWAEFCLTVRERSREPVTGRFAFRYWVTDSGPDGTNGDYIGIDTVSVTQPGEVAGCASPTDIPWLAADPTSGTTAPGASEPVTVSVDTADLDLGTFEALLCVTTNDPNAELVEVPVSLTVGAAAAQVEIYVGEYKFKDPILHVMGPGGADVQPLDIIPAADWLVVGLQVDDAAGKIYWTHGSFNDGRIQRANLDGTDIEPVFTGLTNPRGLALDAAAGKLYWSDTQDRRIYRGNIDGTGLEAIIDDGAQHGRPTLDLANGKIYYGNFDQMDIRRANLDGTGEEILFGGVWTGIAIALDHGAGKLYYADSNTSLVSNYIARANFDGSDLEILYEGQPTSSGFTGIGLDLAAGKLYWSDEITDVEKGVWEANLDGTGATRIYESPEGWNAGAMTLVTQTAP